MLKNRKVWIIALLSLGIFIGTSLAHAQPTTFSEEQLGIRKEPLYDDSAVTPVRGEPIKEGPGESTRFERAFENSPPLISHDITGMLPIAQNENLCLDCHMPDEAASIEATAIPKSHFVDFQTGKDLKGKLDGDRYNCMQCHLIQTRITPPIANLFQGEFRGKKGRYRSNLIDILNEGVEAD